MSKVLKVSNSNYKIAVQDGGTITLDTGTEQGSVVVTGDLEVRGNTTTVESETMVIRDNIITLSADNISAGIPASLNYRSGLEINRGSAADAYFVYDETIQWATGGTSGTGTFTFEVAGSTIPINTNGIVSGGNLYLIQAGSGVISVTGTTNYEENVFYYSGGSVAVNPSTLTEIIDDDHIPNAKAVADYVDYVFATFFQDRIDEGDTFVETKDFSVTGLPSAVEVGVDGTLKAVFYDNRVEIEQIRIEGSTITSTDSNEDLILSAPGAGSVRVDDNLLINSTPNLDDTATDPTAPTDGLKLYVKSEDTGGTGLFFVNSDSTQDEIVSKNRALLFSMIF